MKRDEHFETKLNEVRQRFDQWRQERGPRRRPIPEPLWEAAAALARAYGVCPVAQSLRLQYAKLKERSSSKTMATNGPPIFPFVEVAMPDLGLSSGCTVKLENGSGAHMTIGLSPASQRVLIDLAALFLKPQA